MKDTFTLNKFEMGMHYIILDNSVANKFLQNGHKRILCKLNDEIEFHCAIMPSKSGYYFINIGQKYCKQLNIKEGSIVKAKFALDDSEFQFEMPEELQAVLDTDPEAQNIFNSLTKGKQRSLIYLITLVKSSDKKIERALLITKKLKESITSPKLILKKDNL